MARQAAPWANNGARFRVRPEAKEPQCGLIYMRTHSLQEAPRKKSRGAGAGAGQTHADRRLPAPRSVPCLKIEMFDLRPAKHPLAEDRQAAPWDDPNNPDN